MAAHNKSFTLIEVIVAIFLLTAGTVGSYSLIQRTIAFTSVSSSKLTAAYLAQEGIEIVRNIRDGNWLEKRWDSAVSWDEGLPSGDWEADYNDLALPNNWVDPGNFLNIDGNNFYSYDVGDPTKFKRKITINNLGTKIIVSVRVTWSERAMDQQVTAETELYDWR